MVGQVPALWLALVAASLMVLPAGAAAQNYGGDDKSVEIRGSAGSFHAGSDADPRELGLPVYPGARLKHDDNHESNTANLGIFTQLFGVKLVVLNYASDDAPEKIVNFYREKLKKFGKVMECHYSDDHPQVQPGKDDDSQGSREVKCEGDNKGNNIELKVGTEDNQHAVAIEPSKSGNGAIFALVYFHARGKQADI